MSRRLVEPLLRFCVFQDGSCHHVGFQKFEILTIAPRKGAKMHYLAKFHHNWWSSCGDFWHYIWDPLPLSPMVLHTHLRFSEWRPSTILNFENSNFVMAVAVNKPILHHRTKFCEDWLNCCWDIAIFVIFKMVATAILDNSKIRNFNVDPLKSPRCTTVPNFIKIDRAVVEIWWFNDFKNGDRLSSWIFEIQIV